MESYLTSLSKLDKNIPQSILKLRANNQRSKEELIDSKISINLQNLDSIPEGQFEIDVEGVKFNTLYFSGSDEYLHVFLSGHVSSPKSIHQRWSWNVGNKTLCIADPMFTTHNIELGWYFGTNDCDYRELVSKIIKKVAYILDIKPSNIIIYGSSGGATSAIYVGSNIPHCNVVAINPQTDITQWNYGKYVRKIKNFMGVDVTSKELAYRNNMALTIANSKTTNFFIIVNMLSELDIDALKILENELNFEACYGIHSYSNITCWIYAADKLLVKRDMVFDAHASQESNIKFYLIDWVVKNSKIISNNPELALIMTELWGESNKQRQNQDILSLKLMSKQGDSRAQYLLYQMYATGELSIPKGEADQYLLESVKNLNPNAISVIFTKQDYNHKFSKEYLYDAAISIDKNSDIASYWLGRSYNEGLFTDVDISKSIAYLFQAISLSKEEEYINELLSIIWKNIQMCNPRKYFRIAHHYSIEGYTQAFHWLALAYHHGVGTNVDSLLAKKYYELSLDEGNEKSISPYICLLRVQSDDCSITYDRILEKALAPHVTYSKLIINLLSTFPNTQNIISKWKDFLQGKYHDIKLLKNDSINILNSQNPEPSEFTNLNVNSALHN